ncbi:MAG: hypothetical protein RSG77_19870 [Hafnia sp.]
MKHTTMSWRDYLAWFAAIALFTGVFLISAICCCVVKAVEKGLSLLKPNHTPFGTNP